MRALTSPALFALAVAAALPRHAAADTTLEPPSSVDAGRGAALPVSAPSPSGERVRKLDVVPVIMSPRPTWSSRFGIGVRAADVVLEGGANAWAVGGELLYRLSNHFSAELGAEYQHSGDTTTRADVPVTLGLRLHVGNPDWIFCPFLVIAAGLDLARRELGGGTESAALLDGQAGGGAELRLGPRVTLSGDIRADGRHRAAGSSANALNANDSPRAAAAGSPGSWGDGWGLQFRFAAAVYF
jgi:hypothetical protein